MQVFVLDKNKQPLMPCHRARARELLKKKRAVVYRKYPFTIIILDRTGGDFQKIEVKIDPGSKTTGIALVGSFLRGKKVIWAANLKHRGSVIKKSLESRQAFRRGRRFRKTRYRIARFDNRTRKKGWLPPSLLSRVNNVFHWTNKLSKCISISSIGVETVRFDMQKIQNPEISGLEYQRGTLYGYEIREYLLEKWKRKCAYCGGENRRLEIDHITPKSHGGSNAVSNLLISCRGCNEKKGNVSIQEFLKKKPKIISKILKYKNVSLRDATAVNATRFAIGEALKKFEKPIFFWSGGRTKYNRISQGYPKDHWIDAVCIGKSGENVFITKNFFALNVSATGRGNRQMCRIDKYGFPRTSAKKQKRIQGFQTGDLVKAIVPIGKKAGIHIGKVAIRSSGNFNIQNSSQTIQGIKDKYCYLLQKADGYIYNNKKKTGGGDSSLP